jgi:phosphoribosylglycinamide formyltransferase-1
MEQKKRILVFNSGTGSGLRELLESTKTGVLNGEIVGLITNNASYPCVKIAEKFGIPWVLMERFEAEDYQKIVERFKPDLICLSGWLKKTKGLPPEITINIHPGPLPKYGGKGMFGHNVHEAVVEDSQKGLITKSEITMHFVNENYDEGPVFFRYPVLIRPEDTAESLGARVNKIEHGWQSYITNLVLEGQICLKDGKVIVPDWYRFL